MQEHKNPVGAADLGHLSRAFSRLGWTGFWLQVVVGSILIVGMVSFYVFARSVKVSDGALPFVEYLAIVNILML